MNKTKAVEQHLKDGKSISTWEAIKLYRATRLSAIIFNLKNRKKDALDIISKDCKGTDTNYTEYSLRTSGTSNTNPESPSLMIMDGTGDKLVLEELVGKPPKMTVISKSGMFTGEVVDSNIYNKHKSREMKKEKSDNTYLTYCIYNETKDKAISEKFPSIEQALPYLRKAKIFFHDKMSIRDSNDKVVAE